MGQMKIKDIIIDSLRYSASDFKVLILLGIVLLLADMADELSFLGNLSATYGIIISFAIILLAILEAGYVFRIIEETIQGSKILPRFDNLKGMFSHGINEMIVLLLYFVVPLLLILIFFFDFVISMDMNDISDGSEVLFIIFLFIGVMIYVLFPAVILHRAHNNGNLSSSFDFVKIYHKIRNIGLKRLVIVYLSIFIMVATIREILTPSLVGIGPFLLGLFSDLFIAPYLLIFTSRFLGLIDN